MRRRQAARLLAGVVVFLACIAWLDSPLRPGATQRLQMLGFAPQAWGFFASPREPRTEVYRLRNGVWERADTPLGSAANLFGLRKAILSHSPEFRTSNRRSECGAPRISPRNSFPSPRSSRSRCAAWPASLG